MTVNGLLNAHTSPATEERVVGRVDDGVDAQLGDVAAEDGYLVGEALACQDVAIICKAQYNHVLLGQGGKHNIDQTLQ